MRYNLVMPAAVSDPTLASVPHAGVVVVVGANGSGKSRLGYWLEREAGLQRVRRLAAQKLLTFPHRTNATINTESETRNLGLHIDESGRVLAQQREYDGDPRVGMLRDFELLLRYLFAEHISSSVDYRDAAKQTGEHRAPDETILEAVVRVWESVFVGRTLLVEHRGGTIQCQSSSGMEPYSGTMMSDGERVAFYLIGQCLVAPSDTVIVLDEPEIHLHRTILARLWDVIEAERGDCQFVYLTHDLDFAISRVGAPKVCLREYDGTHWDWYLVPAEDDLPEDVSLQVLGSRKPVLFIEGDQGSIDYWLFSRLYPSYTVIPCAACEVVIHAVKAFTRLSRLHHLACYGLIDRDHRGSDQLTYLEQHNVFAIDVSEVENLFLSEQVLRCIAEQLDFGDEIPIILEDVKSAVLAELECEKERLATSIVKTSVRRAAERFSGRSRNLHELQAVWNGYVSGVDIERLYRDAIADIEAIVSAYDYEEALRIYDNKGLARFANSRLNLGDDGVTHYVQRQFLARSTPQIVEPLRRLVPSLPQVPGPNVTDVPGLERSDG